MESKGTAVENSNNGCCYLGLLATMSIVRTFRSGISSHQRRQAVTQRMFAACGKKQKLALEHTENQRLCSKPR